MADYVIRSGDTLSALARRFNTTVEALASANGIANPNRISAGATITVPGGDAPMAPTTGAAPLPRPSPVAGLPPQGASQPGPMPRPNPSRPEAPPPRPNPGRVPQPAPTAAPMGSEMPPDLMPPAQPAPTMQGASGMSGASLPDLAAAAQASNDPAELAAISQEIAARQVQTQSIQPTQAQQMGGQFGFAPVKNMDAPPVAPWDLGGPGPGQVQPPAGANGGLFVPTTGTDMGRFSTPRTGGLPMSTQAMGDTQRPQPVPGYGPGPGDPQMAPNPATDWANPPPPIPGEVPFTGAGDRNFIPQGRPGQFGLESEPGTLPVMGQGEGNPIMQMLIQLLSEGGGSPANRQLIPMLIQQLSAQGAR